MPPDDSTLEEALLWLEYAIADLAVARMPLPAQSKYEMLLFHAQQAAEKALKAVLIRLGIDFPRTHNPLALVDILPPQFNSLPFLIAATALTEYAILLRYPGVNAPVNETRYARMLKLAEDVVAWAQQLIYQ